MKIVQCVPKERLTFEVKHAGAACSNLNVLTPMWAKFDLIQR